MLQPDPGNDDMIEVGSCSFPHDSMSIAQLLTELDDNIVGFPIICDETAFSLLFPDLPVQVIKPV